MRIAQVAPPFLPIPPGTYGGTERVVSTLTETLVQRGHDVTLFASGDSVTSAHLVPVVPRAIWHGRDEYRDLAPFFAIVLGALASRVGEFDIVHNHLDHVAYPLARLAPCPVLTTLHGRLDRPELAPLYAEFSDVPLASISDAQRGPLPGARWMATIYHGIDIEAHTFNPRPGKYLAYLGRISPEKGLDTAIRVARRTGLPLKIAARMPLPYTDDPNVRADWLYYEQQVLPLLGGVDVQFVGEVDDPRKSELLRNARALLFPIQWPEPFGLVMPEALACGTPVVAFRQGSVPEVVEHGVTGFICDNEDEMVDAVGHLREIDRRRCRSEAERRFSPASMAEQYERVYEQLVRERRSAARREAGPTLLPRVA